MKKMRKNTKKAERQWDDTLIGGNNAELSSDKITKKTFRFIEEQKCCS